MSAKILVINPGSTSTKIAVYESEKPVMVRNIPHSTEELKQFADELEKADDFFREKKNNIEKEIEEEKAKGVKYREMYDKVLESLSKL